MLIFLIPNCTINHLNSVKTVIELLELPSFHQK